MAQLSKSIHPQSPFLKLRRRFKRVTRKLIGGSIYYGLMLSIGMVQSKAVICPLCQSMLQNLKASEFWILFGLLSFLFTLLTCFILEFARGWLTNQKMDRSTYLLYPNYMEPKYTRSGAIYGYRPK